MELTLLWRGSCAMEWGLEISRLSELLRTVQRFRPAGFPRIN